LQVRLFSIQRSSLEAGSYDLNDLLHAFSGEILYFCYRALDNRCQGEVRDVATEAGQDILRY